MNDLSMILFDNKMSMIEEERKHFAEMLQYEYRSSILNEDAEIIYEGIFESLMNFIKSIIDKIIGFFTSIINFITGKKEKEETSDCIQRVNEIMKDIDRYSDEINNLVKGDKINEDVKIYKIDEWLQKKIGIGALSNSLNSIPLFKMIQSLEYDKITKETFNQTKNNIGDYYSNFLKSIGIQDTKDVVYKDGDKVGINQDILLKSISVKESIKGKRIEITAYGCGLTDIKNSLSADNAESDFADCRNNMKRIRSSLEKSKKDETINSEKYSIVKKSFQLLYDYTTTCGSTWIKICRRYRSMIKYNANGMKSFVNKIRTGGKTANKK